MASIQNTHSQYNLPEFGKRVSKKHERVGIAAHFPESDVQKAIELDCTLIDYYDDLLSTLERHILACAKEHDPKSLALLQTIPGTGRILALIILCEIHDITRFPRVQDFMSYCRLVKCSRESAGKLYGHSGDKIGNAHLKWAFSEAACTFLRGNHDAQKLHQRLVKKHGREKPCPSSPPRSGVRSILCSHGGAYSTETNFLQVKRKRPRSTSNWRLRDQPALGP